jgi:hypothetical protein
MMLLDAWMMLMIMFSIFNHVVLIFFLGRDIIPFQIPIIRVTTEVYIKKQI